MRLGQVLLACALCLVGVAFFTSLKTSFLYLLALKQQSNGKQWYAALFFVLLVPEIVTFLRIIWGSSFVAKGRLAEWPPCKIIFLGIFTTVLESAALAFFTLEVSPQLPGYLVLPLMNVLLFLQMLLEQWKRSTTRNFLPNHNVTSPSFVSRVLHSVAAIFGISIFILSACLLIVLDITEMPRVVALIAAVLTLSVVWSQPIKVYIFQAECSSETVRYNISLLLSIVRIVSLGIFSMAVIPMGGEIDIYDSPKFLWDGITSLGESSVLMSVLAVNCCAGLLTYGLTRVSAYYTTTWSGILIPSILSTTIASVIYILNCFDGIYLTLSVDVCPMSEGSLIVAGFVILLWLLPMLIMRRNYFVPADTFFKPEHENFITFGYSAVCFDQHSLLNYYPCPLVFRETGLNGHGRSRVFMCTTMYREADYEMEQLLKSLAKISKSQRLKKKKIYLEAHIFLDNGADGLTLKEFALQLMALVQNCLVVGRSDRSIYKTPYGLQISCVLPGGMPLFVHLKDPTFVKAKKRWSQVMYMNYIIDYRIKMTTHIAEIQHQMKLKKEVGPTKYTQMIMQIRSLLDNLKDQDEEQEKGSIYSKCGSAYSSDQEIKTGDDMSETSSQRYPEKATEYSDGRSTSPPSTSNSYANLVSAEYPLGKTTPIYMSETSDQTGSHGSGDDGIGRPSTVFPSSPSYTSFISTDFPISKVNPAYIPDKNELMPPKWLPEFTSDSTFTGHAPSLSDIRGSARDLNMLEFASNEKISTISKDKTALDLSQLTPAYDDRTYILATDADMQFNDMSVLDLVETCNSDLRLGAACGRTHPFGKKKHPIVWFQMFEYAKDFWLIKSAHNIIGSVMCCPGCFSLYRVKALEGVLHLYSEPTFKPWDVFTKDTGEDRWMCTLMMLRGWKLQYSNFAYNGTYCPDTVEEFIKQRRRWILSDFANSLMVFRNLPQLIRSNGCFSVIYAIYLLQLFFIVVLLPGSTVIMLTVGLDMLVGLNFYILTPIVSFILILYGYLCIRLTSNMQILLTKFSIVLLGLCMSAVVLGAAYFVIIDLVTDNQEDALQLQEDYILIAVTGSLLYAALLHPKECWLLFNGLFYLFFFPAMQMLLPVYALCNIVDQTWGTRDNQKAKLPKLLCFPKMKFRRKKKKNKGKKSADADIVDPEDSEVSLDQLKPMRSEEQLFWTQLLEKLIGKDINLGLEKDVLADGLKSLRFRTLIAILVANVIWVIGLGLFYATSVEKTDSLSGYGIMIGVLYGFSFVIHVVGMTVYRFSDCAHRLGKKIFKDEKSHWVTRREHGTKMQF
ncbi:uncharacterized protein LOC124119335 [Haliotis rufescens]|uniref:uncharacterized protein LOC124119335 n=1 Tax=Haliotis rufescens TaxID=6454 RepID=UPI00201F6454|nr:uncharacterized protein LOC124119335 [Haliotis rufescens]XP_048239235.1 uncharacterized protein LOC124119335 [Haliotis rufescens]XP_048239236.1 uncharacterized protein LOC124119335 [Haliotis rufescens]